MLQYDPSMPETEQSELRPRLLIDLDYAADSDDQGNAKTQTWDGSDANKDLPIPEEETEQSYADMSKYLPSQQTSSELGIVENETSFSANNKEADDIWGKQKKDYETAKPKAKAPLSETSKRRRNRGQRTVRTLFILA